MTKQIKMAQTKEKNNVIRTLTKTIHVGMRVFGYLIKIYFIKDINLFKIKEKKTYQKARANRHFCITCKNAMKLYFLQKKNPGIHHY